MWSVYGGEVCESGSGAMLSQCFGSAWSGVALASAALSSCVVAVLGTARQRTK